MGENFKVDHFFLYFFSNKLISWSILIGLSFLDTYWKSGSLGLNIYERKIEIFTFLTKLLDEQVE